MNNSYFIVDLNFLMLDTIHNYILSEIFNGRFIHSLFRDNTVNCLDYKK